MPLIKIIAASILIFCLLGCVRSNADLIRPAYEQPETGVYGRVAGAAAGAVWVYAYRTRQDGFRGPADFAARVDGGGHYLLDLLPGRWFLVARSRLQDALAGPPQAGDRWAVYPDNPVVLQQREVRQIDLRLQPVAATMLLRGASLGREDTGFHGRLVGPDKTPVVGAVALAYRDQDYRRMPEHSSAAVSDSGSFTLLVAEAGRYCLVARQGKRGQPVQGELYGLLGIGAAGCREVGLREIIDVGEIHLTPYLR